jgi:hypothetical protein
MFALYVLQLSFKCELENAARPIQLISREIGGWYRTAMHGRKAMAFVIMSKNSRTELIDRLRPLLDSLYELENYWCFYAPSAIESKHGGIDPMTSRIIEGWDRVGQSREAEDVRHPKGRQA